MTVAAEPCEVVWDNNCTAPSSDEDASGTRARCYACGLPTCTKCSTIRKYCGGLRRICATCEENYFDDGPERLLLRAYRRAGYPSVTLADVRRELAGTRR